MNELTQGTDAIVFVQVLSDQGRCTAIFERTSQLTESRAIAYARAAGEQTERASAQGLEQQLAASSKVQQQQSKTIEILTKEFSACEQDRTRLQGDLKDAVRQAHEVGSFTNRIGSVMCDAASHWQLQLQLLYLRGIHTSEPSTTEELLSNIGEQSAGSPERSVPLPEKRCEEVPPENVEVMLDSDVIAMDVAARASTPTSSVASATANTVTVTSTLTKTTTTAVCPAVQPLPLAAGAGPPLLAGNDPSVPPIPDELTRNIHADVVSSLSQQNDADNPAVNSGDLEPTS